VKIRATLTLFCLLALTGCATADKRPPGKATQSPPSSPAQGTAFAGVGLVDARENGQGPAGAKVRGVVAGPAAIAGLRANDRIVRIDNVEVDGASATTIINSAAPGDRLVLDVIRNNEQLTLIMVIDTEENWIPPSAFASAIPFTETGLSGMALVPDRMMTGILMAAPEAEPVLLRIDQMFADLARDDTGYHKLPLIRTAMLNPAAMERWQDQLADALRPFELRREAVIEIMCATLAVACRENEHNAAIAPVTLQTFAQAIDAANQQVRTSFEAAQIDRAQTYDDLRYLMHTTAADRTLIGQPEVARGLRAMQSSTRLDLAALLDVSRSLLANAANLPEYANKARPVPAQLRGIVEGEIVDYVRIGEGYVVVGGPGANRYAMNQIYAVIDVGGNDTYRWNDGIALETQTIVDLGGDDNYQATTAGPAAGWFGAAVLIDIAGDDQYQSALGGCGAGAFGFGFLFDDEGQDSYRCAAWSLGSSIYGGGALVDQGTQIDLYESQVFSQGVGGPRGMGILVDAGGDDLYRANGPIPSAYKTPGSFMAFSQGVGTGIRPYDSGGVGVLLDYGGNDRYEGGEFAQGGGYLWGIGMLRDESGHDLYYGTRYAQGFAVHQAFGMLTDLSGDDIYWGMSAATQGAAWDQSIAVLFDAEGDDIYRAQSLGQGAAAQQARAMLRDAAGNDRYWSFARDTQGAAGNNRYHFNPNDPVYSLGILLDERGDDVYSTGVENGATVFRRDANPKDGRGVAGVVVDLP